MFPLLQVEASSTLPGPVKGDPTPAKNAPPEKAHTALPPWRAAEGGNTFLGDHKWAWRERDLEVQFSVALYPPHQRHFSLGHGVVLKMLHTI